MISSLMTLLYLLCLCACVIGLKPYVCSVCDYAGRSRSNLKTHMNRHNSERRHLCDLCGKKFKSKVTLKSHRLTHTDEGLCILPVNQASPALKVNREGLLYVVNMPVTDLHGKSQPGSDKHGPAPHRDVGTCESFLKIYTTHSMKTIIQWFRNSLNIQSSQLYFLP